MRTSEHESPLRVREVVDDIFDRRLAEALELIRADLEKLDAHYSPGQINHGLVLALLQVKAAGPLR